MGIDGEGSPWALPSTRLFPRRSPVAPPACRGDSVFLSPILQVKKLGFQEAKTPTWIPTSAQCFPSQDVPVQCSVWFYQKVLTSNDFLQVKSMLSRIYHLSHDISHLPVLSLGLAEFKEPAYLLALCLLPVQSCFSSWNPNCNLPTTAQQASCLAWFCFWDIMK